MAKSRVRRHHPIGDELRRIALRRLDQALSEARFDDTDAAVHEVRRRTKQVRALVRLVRPVSPDLYERENPALRDAARGIAVARDATVALDTLHRLVTREPDRLDALTEQLRVRLARWRAEIGRDELTRRIAGAGAELALVRDRIPDWPLPNLGFDTVAPGLERSYRQARRRMRDAEERGTTAALHEWRKRVKDHRYQVTMLRTCWPGPMRAREKALHELTDLLGDDHDLAVLRDLVCTDPQAIGGVEVAATVTEVVDRERARLQAGARVVGARCFAEKPKRLAARFRAYWDAAESDPASPDSQGS